jgi:hypothetical protein
MVAAALGAYLIMFPGARVKTLVFVFPPISPPGSSWDAPAVPV